MTRLDEIRARLEAATPGPWWFAKGGLGDNFIGYGTRNPADCGIVLTAEFDFNQCRTVMSCSDNNSELIANAHNDISYLLAEVERLEAENKGLQVDVQAMRNNLRNALGMEGVQP